jgi:hypothetical protein
MAAGLGNVAGWLSAHPHTLVSGAIGLGLGVAVTIPLGWSLPDPAAAMVGAFIGAGAVVGGSLWAANAKQRLEEQAAVNVRTNNEKRIAELMAIEATQHIIPLRQEINSARVAYKCAETYFLAGTEQYMLDRLKLPSAGRFPTGLALAQLPHKLAMSIAELNFFSGSYANVVAMTRFTDNPDDQTLQAFLDMDLGATLDQIQIALVRVAELIAPYVPAISATDFSERGDKTYVSANSNAR